ncbi:hypothetical protein [Flavobacterium sp.]|uniref:hypothetical protein n=1 Tax=Flavobacterium sp. TaxID=239 RepID=UPI002620C373|nr:hypothetical protein [Flavobacterium sp.]
MNYLKYTQYVYLLFSGFFVYDGISKLNSGESPWISFGIAAVSLFMFFFRRNFAKKFENRNKNT